MATDKRGKRLPRRSLRKKRYDIDGVHKVASNERYEKRQKEMKVNDYKIGVELSGYISDMPEDIYHNTEGFISKSSLGQLAKETPFRFFNSKKKEQTPAMAMGTALHCAILEPKKFSESYILMPDCKSKASKEYKEAVKNNLGKEILTGQNCDNLTGMVKAVYANDFANELLSLEGFNELSGFHVDSETGVKLRHRFDKLCKCGIAVDIKKTQSVNYDEISKTIDKFGYDMQDSLYSDAYKAITGEDLKAFYFVFVEETYPHEVAVVYLDDISKQVGRDRYRDLLNEYCMLVSDMSQVTNNKGASMVSLPEWTLRQYENEIEDGEVY